MINTFMIVIIINTQVLILHNHGIVAMGESIEEAFHTAHMVVKACEIQVRVCLLMEIIITGIILSFSYLPNCRLQQCL